MRNSAMSAADFKAELKRLGLGQSGFAIASETPLRIIQSWANGKQSIPSDINLIIAKVESLSEQEKLMVLAETLPEKNLEVLAHLAGLFREHEISLEKLQMQIRVLQDSDTEKQNKIEAQDKLWLKFTKRHELLIHEVEQLKKRLPPVTVFHP